MKNSLIVSKNRNILICPLDWGLGHATRCIPVISCLLEHGFTPIIAASGGSLKLLQDEFPGLNNHYLPGYNIKYSEKGSMTLNLSMQLPGLTASILSERKAVKQLIKKYNIAGIISDNRFGLGFSQIPSVYITHQIRILANGRMRLFEPILYKFHRSIMNSYKEIWIPDYRGKENLSGILSHSYPPLKKAEFIGPLSRFSVNSIVPDLNFASGLIPLRSRGGTKGEVELSPAILRSEGITLKYFDIVIVISGPEPQRSLFERKILEQISKRSESILIVRGTPLEKDKIKLRPNIVVKNHLPSKELVNYLMEAKVIISRAGYSTIMDLIALNRSAILVPTPGQTEQEYLADYLDSKGWFFKVAQKSIDLNENIDSFYGREMELPEFGSDNVLEKRINALFLSN